MKKTFVILVSAFLLIGCLSFASAFNATGEITTSQTFDFSPGEAISSDFTIEDIQVSSTLGGLISTISKYVERFVDFNGLRIFKDFSTTSPEFTLMAFPVGSVLGGNIVIGKVFELSESVILENRTETENIWITYYVDASWGEGPDFQTLAGLGDPMTTPGGTLQVNSINGNANFVIDGSSYSKPIEVCTEDICPTEQQLSVFGFDFGIDYNSLRTFNNDFNIGRVLILKWDNNLIGFLIDKNRDGQWDFMENIAVGYSTESWEKNVLMLAPPGVYDIYIV